LIAPAQQTAWQTFFKFPHQELKKFFKYFLKGKVEMTLEIITTNEITEKPAGKGRSDPNLNPMLDPPK
jgi:hypothetical protein